MRIEVKGRNLQVTDELRECVERRMDKIGKQVSELATLEVELALRMGEAKQFRSYSRRVERIGGWEAELELLEDEEIKEQFAELRRRVQEEGESLDDVLAEAFALTREVGRRTMAMRHFDVQL